ncbi:hypothetical protein FQN57_004514 [Myotisia sp. PD_48]|nr:hypothetical protein FQN57_004514 [Myotisia sp. PD_48]
MAEPLQTRDTACGKLVLSSGTEKYCAVYPPKLTSLTLLGYLNDKKKQIYSRGNGRSLELGGHVFYMFDDTSCRDKDGQLLARSPNPSAMVPDPKGAPLVVRYPPESLTENLKPFLALTELEEQYEKDNDCKVVLLAHGGVCKAQEGIEKGYIWYQKHIRKYTASNKWTQYYQGTGIAVVEWNEETGHLSTTRLSPDSELLFSHHEPSFGTFCAVADEKWFYLWGNLGEEVYFARIEQQSPTQRKLYEFWDGYQFTSRHTESAPVFSGYTSGSIFKSKLFGDSFEWVFIGGTKSGKPVVSIGVSKDICSPFLMSDLVDEQRLHPAYRHILRVHVHPWALQDRVGQLLVTWDEINSENIVGIKLQFQLSEILQGNEGKATIKLTGTAASIVDSAMDSEARCAYIKMLPPFDYFQQRSARKFKRNERAQRFASLPSIYHSPLTAFDRSVIDKPIEELVHDVHKGALSPLDVLHTYGKVAVKAHEKTNCVTELLLPEAEKWAQSEINIRGPLAGIPISLKDSIQIKGFDTTLGYTKWARQPYAEDGALVKLLKDAGAVPYVKTALPITLLSFESASHMWGACRNPHVPEFSPGGSTGGEAALLALGGRIGIGSDVAGSVRLPAAWSGVYSLRCSTGRWPKAGVHTSMPGQEGIASVFSPMARTLDDLAYFTRSLIKMKPWNYDTTVHPIAWRGDEEDEAQTKKLRVGLMKSDGVVPPTPAIARAIDTTVAALSSAGHTVVEINPPSTATPLIGLNLAAQLLNSDGCLTFNAPFRTGENSDPGADQMTSYANLPRPFRYLYYLYVRYIKRDKTWAYLIRDFGLKNAAEQWKLVAKRETFRATWHQWWNAKEQNYDFILCPANATPALPHGGMRDGFSSCGYTFLFNLLDYSAGVIPIDRVDAKKDGIVTADGKKATGKNAYKRVLKQLGADSAVSRSAWKHYNPTTMHGLPTAVQIVGRRWQEEKVLGYMAAVEQALEDYKGPNGEGGKYKLLDVE